MKSSYTDPVGLKLVVIALLVLGAAVPGSQSISAAGDPPQVDATCQGVVVVGATDESIGSVWVVIDGVLVADEEYFVPLDGEKTYPYAGARLDVELRRTAGDGESLFDELVRRPAECDSGSGKLSPSERRCISVFGDPGGAALMNLTPLLADGFGDGQLVSSDVTNPPTASNVNFGPGTVDPNVAVTSIGADGRACFVNSVHTNVHLVADHLGTLASSVYTPATASGASDRRVDTRKGIGGGGIPPSGRKCFSVSGNPGDAAIVNLTAVLASAPGDGQVVSSDVANPPVASNVNFRPGSVDPNVAIAKIGSDGKICFVNSVHASVHLVADHLGTIESSAYDAAQASGAPDRRVDTRKGLGGGKIEPSGRRCFSVSGSPGDAAFVNLTPVLADGAGDGQLISSDVKTAPKASNVNFRAGSVDPNVAIAPIGADGEVCYVNSTHTSVHLVADHLGTIKRSAYTPASTSGAPERRIDTRRTQLGVFSGPQQVEIEYICNRRWAGEVEAIPFRMTMYVPHYQDTYGFTGALFYEGAMSELKVTAFRRSQFDSMKSIEETVYGAEPSNSGQVLGRVQLSWGDEAQMPNGQLDPRFPASTDAYPYRLELVGRFKAGLAFHKVVEIDPASVPNCFELAPTGPNRVVVVHEY